MKLSSVWQNYSLWFKISLILILFWFIFSLSLSLVVYFSWPYDVSGFEAIIFRFLIWFFILPSIAIIGIVNSIPFIVEWLFEDIPSPPQYSARTSPILANLNNNASHQQKKILSYKDVSSRLADEKEIQAKEHQKLEGSTSDFEDYDDF